MLMNNGPKEYMSRGGRHSALARLVPELVRLLDQTNSVRMLGAQLRRLRDADVIQSLEEQRWLQTAVLRARDRARDYYREVTP